MVCQRVGKAVLWCLAFLVVALIIVIPGTRSAYAQGRYVATTTSASASTARGPTSGQKELIEAQTQYYNRQVRKPWWEYLIEAGTLIGAIGAFVTFSLNYRVTLRVQRDNLRTTLRAQSDAQFYEALKRFGDPSPAVRSSAIGLLQKHAEQDEANYRIVVDQLVAGSILETDLAVYTSIIDAIAPIVPVHPLLVINRLRRGNDILQRQVVYNLGRFFASLGATDTKTVSTEHWELAAETCEYEADVLSGLVQRAKWAKKFHEVLHSRSRIWDGQLPEKKLEKREKLQHELGIAAERLRTNVRLCVEALVGCGAVPDWLPLDNVFLVDADLWKVPLTNAHLSSAQLHGAFLAGANLRDATLCKAQVQRANLSSAVLWHASLQGADLRDARLDGVKLAGATIDAETNFTGANWWEADFFYPDTQEPDLTLLERLYGRYGDEVPQDTRAVHQSVSVFIMRRDRR